MSVKLSCHLCGEPITTQAAGIDKNGERDWWALTWDHVIPKSAGGTDDPENLRPAHLVCNIRRKNMPLEDWRESRRWEQEPVARRQFECLPRPCLYCGEMIDEPKALQLLHRDPCARLRANQLTRQAAQQRFGGAK